jgi:hypothetical protein
MNEAWFVPDATTVTVFGGGCALLGLTGLLERTGGRRVWTWTNGLAVLVLLGAAAAFAAGLPRSACAAALAVGAFPLALTAARVGALSAVLSRPRLHGAALLAAGPLAILAWVGYVDYFYFGPEGSFSHTPPIEPGPPLVAAAVHARTDRGADLPLYTFAPSQEVADIVRDKEEKISQTLALKLIRTAPPSFDTNCHGWVFCGGHYCVRDSEVDRILADNGYRMVSQPQPGDVVIYRGLAGEVVHTGLVRLAQDDEVLVESKWGRLGRYLHAPGDQIYGDRWTFYHTERPNHLLDIEPGELAE